jgi:phytanoyl-CoA hydroxylase
MAGERVEADSTAAQAQRDEFLERGYAILHGLLRQSELEHIETLYDEAYRGALSGAIRIPGRDFCDMAGTYDVEPKDFIVPNIMLPRRYIPAFRNNVYERRSRQVAADLYPDVRMVYDYDQLLNKKPQRKDAVFPMHQDMNYWPPRRITPDTRTATFSLAIDSTYAKNGAIKFLPGTHKAQAIRPMRPFQSSRDEGHALVCEYEEWEPFEFAEVPRGSASVHEEYVVHGSGGNLSDGERRTCECAPGSRRWQGSRVCGCRCHCVPHRGHSASRAKVRL